MYIKQQRDIVFLCDHKLQAYTPMFQKTVKIVFLITLLKCSRTLIISGPKMAKTTELCKVDLFSISHNLCQCTTMWNTDAPNSYISRWL